MNGHVHLHRFSTATLKLAASAILLSPPILVGCGKSTGTPARNDAVTHGMDLGELCLQQVAVGHGFTLSLGSQGAVVNGTMAPSGSGALAGGAFGMSAGSNGGLVVAYLSSPELACLGNWSSWSERGRRLCDLPPFSRSAPSQVNGASIGPEHIALAVEREDGEALFLWGNNESGQLGGGRIEQSYVEVRFPGAQSLATDRNSTYVVAEGRLYTSGAPVFPWVNPSREFQPVDLGLRNPIRKVAASDVGACVLTQDGASCWLREAGAIAERAIPDASHIVLGSAHGCYVDNSKQVRCWGDNTFDQLGSIGQHPFPPGQPVVTQDGRPLVGAEALDASGKTSCAVDSDRRTYCWGWNGEKQISLPVPNRLFPYAYPVDDGPEVDGGTASDDDPCRGGHDGWIGGGGN